MVFTAGTAVSAARTPTEGAEKRWAVEPRERSHEQRARVPARVPLTRADARTDTLALTLPDTARARTGAERSRVCADARCAARGRS